MPPLTAVAALSARCGIEVVDSLLDGVRFLIHPHEIIPPPQTVPLAAVC